jgi:hypothetical protein
MKKNIGKKDRILRFVTFIILFVLVFISESLLSKIIFGALALFTLFEVVNSWCLLNKILGRNTCSVKYEKNH